MHLAMAGQHGFGGILVVVEGQRRVLLGKPLDGRRHLHVVLAFLGAQREGIDGLRRRQLDQLPGAALGGGQGLAGARHCRACRAPPCRRPPPRRAWTGPCRACGRCRRPLPCRSPLSHSSAPSATWPDRMRDTDSLPPCGGVDRLHDLHDRAVAVRRRRGACASPRCRAHRGGWPSAAAARHCPFRRCRSAPASPCRRADRRRGRRRSRPSAARSPRAIAPSAGRRDRPAFRAWRSAPRARAPCRRREFRRSRSRHIRGRCRRAPAQGRSSR